MFFVLLYLLVIDKPKESMKLLELMNEPGRVLGCKTNMQKSLPFLYINS